MFKHVTEEEIQARQAELEPSPRDNGTLEMIVCRPNRGERLVIERGILDPAQGLIGDNWRARGSDFTDDGTAHPDMQVTLMNSRILQTISVDRSQWPLAGDQLIVDLDLVEENLPPGQKLSVGQAVLEITDFPHTGCGQFTERFGHAAIRFVNSKEGRKLHRRGIYARVVQEGVISAGDTIRKI